MQVYCLTPMIMSHDLNRAVAFYSEFLGFDVVSSFEPEGKLVWAEMAHDDVRFMLNLAGQTRPLLPQDYGSLSAIFYVELDDLEAIHEKLTRVGFKPSKIATQFYRRTEFEVDDPDGNHLILSRESRLGETVTPE